MRRTGSSRAEVRGPLWRSDETPFCVSPAGRSSGRLARERFGVETKDLWLGGKGGKGVREGKERREGGEGREERKGGKGGILSTH